MSNTKTQNQIDTLIEQAIQGHAGTRDAMRWLAAQVRSAALDEVAGVCATERSDFIELAARNDGRQSDMAFGSVNSAERISEAIEQLKGKQ